MKCLDSHMYYWENCIVCVGEDNLSPTSQTLLTEQRTDECLSPTNLQEADQNKFIFSTAEPHLSQGIINLAQLLPNSEEVKFKPTQELITNVLMKHLSDNFDIIPYECLNILEILGAGSPYECIASSRL